MGALTWSFDTWSGCPEHDRETPSLTVADPCIWHGSGTNFSRRQSATTAGAPADHARVCLAAPPPASATLLACVVDESKLRRLSRDDGARALSLGSLGHIADGGLAVRRRGAAVPRRIRRVCVDAGSHPQSLSVAAPERYATEAPNFVRPARGLGPLNRYAQQPGPLPACCETLS